MQREGQQNSLTEAREVPATKGSPFECLDGVVAALCEAVGKTDVKGIEDIILPVAQHSSAIIEFRKPEPVAGVESEIESAAGFCSVWSGHEVVEDFIQRVALRQLIGEVKHDVKGSSVLIGQFVAVCKKQPTGVLEVAALICGQMFLHALANVVHDLRAEAHDVETVDDDLCIGKEGSGHIPETAVHVHDGVFHLVSVGERTQIILHTFHSSFRQNVQNMAVQRVGDDALKSLSAQISLEFVE